MTGVGVVGSISITKIILNKFGSSLPGLSGTTTSAGSRNLALLAYSVLIPGVLGILARKYSRSFSDGLIIGGISNAAQIAINTYAPADTRAALGFGSSIGGYQPIRGLGAGSFGSAPRGSGLGVLASASPFPSSNWGK